MSEMNQRAKLVERKMRCFSSSWWAVERESDVLDEDGELVRPGRARRFVLLSGGELMRLAQTGSVALHGVTLHV